MLKSIILSLLFGFIIWVPVDILIKNKFPLIVIIGLWLISSTTFFWGIMIGENKARKEFLEKYNKGYRILN